MSTRVIVVYGTRPETIKLAPVITGLRARPDRFDVVVCTTAQHRAMVDQVQDVFGLSPDIDLDLMTPAQTPNGVMAGVFSGIDPVLASVRPDWLLVQGDTTTAMAVAIAAFHRRIAIGHVEAGLRTEDLTRPFPEEANRRVTDLLATAAFAPTATARDALLEEGVGAHRVHLTGNTVIDALRQIEAQLPPADPDGDSYDFEVLLTVHRRESWGAPIRRIFGAVAELARRFPEVRWVYPVHPNPEVLVPAREILGDVANVELHHPFDYATLVRHLRRARFVATDSGGIQEEAPTFGTPVLVLRERTERPEGVAAGVARLVGVDPEAIVSAATELLTDDRALAAMRVATNPYGDGHAADRIIAVLAGELVEPFNSAIPRTWPESPRFAPSALLDPTATTRSPKRSRTPPRGGASEPPRG